jgi:hypothetical protein
MLNISISERTTVKRTIYPQGHLSGLFRTLKQSGVDLERFIMSVDLDDPYFKQRKVAVISRADYEMDSIGSINVTVNYGGEPKNVILDSASSKGDLSWASILEPGGMKREVTASYKVNFKGVDSSEQPIMLESPTRVVTVDNLEIQPRELYAIMQVPVVALNFPWDRYSHVEVMLRYKDEAHRINLEEDFLLDKQNPEKTWKIFAQDSSKTSFLYKLIYRAVDNQDIEIPWAETDLERLVIRDPFPNKRTLQIVPNFNFNEVDRVFVDVTYEDKANDVLEERSFEFSSTDPATKTFSVDLVDSNQRLVAFETVIMFKDGRMIEIPPSFTLDRRIVVRADMKGHRIVRVSAQELDFSTNQLKEAQVDIRYDDEVNGLSFADRFIFKSPGDVSTFEFDYVDKQKSEYRYDITYLFNSGLLKSLSDQSAGADGLILPEP